MCIYTSCDVSTGELLRRLLLPFKGPGSMLRRRAARLAFVVDFNGSGSMLRRLFTRFTLVFVLVLVLVLEDALARAFEVAGGVALEVVVFGISEVVEVVEVVEVIEVIEDVGFTGSDNKLRGLSSRPVAFRGSGNMLRLLAIRATVAADMWSGVGGTDGGEPSEPRVAWDEDMDLDDGDVLAFLLTESFSGARVLLGGLANEEDPVEETLELLLWLLTLVPNANLCGPFWSSLRRSFATIGLTGWDELDGPPDPNPDGATRLGPLPMPGSGTVRRAPLSLASVEDTGDPVKGGPRLIRSRWGGDWDGNLGILLGGGGTDKPVV